MKISFAITVSREINEIKHLVPFLLEHKRPQDEIVILFDENIKVGEDVDFSSRISRKGQLLCAVDIKIFHDLSKINRSNDQVMQQAIGEWRGYAARRLHRSNYLATFIFELLYLVLSRFFGSSRHDRAKIRWRGFRSNRLLPLKINKNNTEGAS